MLINPRERALSSDINRLQAFIDAEIQNAYLYLLQAGNAPDFLGMLDAVPTSLTSPPATTIYGGLLAVPEPTTFSFLVTPGIASVYFPDAVINPDDSQYKFIDDPGVLTSGTLVVGPNAGPGIRIDVLEFTVVDTVIETDNRDIFDPSTGLFAAVTVDKVIKKTLSYRIRAGVAGAGFPGLAAGYTPICVISVPVAAASLDNCEMWDVRPLAQDRVYGPGKTSRLFHHLNQSVVGLDTVSAAPARFMKGSLQAESSDIYRGGGKLRVGAYNAGTSYPTNSLNVSDTANYEPGFAPVANTLHFLYVITSAFGLPRWSKYSGPPGARIPVEPNGIFVFSSKTPNAYSGANATLIIPAVYGLGGAAQNGVCLASGFGHDPGTGLTIGVAVTENDKHWLEPNSYRNCALLSALSNVSIDYKLEHGVTHPNHAKSVIVRVTGTITGGAANAIVPLKCQVTLRNEALTETYVIKEFMPSSIKLSALGAGSFAMTCELPIFPGNTAGVNHFFDVDPADGTVTASECRVIGWSFLPNPGLLHAYRATARAGHFP